MSETTLAPVSGGTPKLNAALAKFQAQVPKVTKDERADIPGRAYNYAGLDAITDAALPLLGKNGLAFASWPTLLDGKFVLVYELLHESGEQKSGIFPLAGSGKPQELGGLITYYRRYALCAVTGIAPGGEDDDAQASNNPQQFDRPRSAAQAFENATPAPARQRAEGNTGQAVRPAQAPGPAAVQPGGEPDPEAQPYADEAHEARVTETVKDIHNRARDAHKLAGLIRNPATGGVGGLGQYLNHRRSVLQKAEQALAALRAAGTAAGIDDAGIELRLKDSCGHDLEEATAEEMAQVTELILKEAGAAA